jgi:hypothetical protein
MAEWLLERPAFDTGGWDQARSFIMLHTKEQITAAAKSLGTFKKKFTDTDIRLDVDLEFGSISVEAPRKTVCRLVQRAVYDCDPLLSPEEEAQIGGGL